MTLAETAEPRTGDAADLRAFIQSSRRLFVLTGAGCSTDSGIPDYRAADGSWKRRPPVEYAPFVREPGVRARYWARSLIGWRSFGGRRPQRRAPRRWPGSSAAAGPDCW